MKSVRIALITAPGVGELTLRELSLKGIRFRSPQFLTLKTQEAVICEISGGSVPKLLSLKTCEDVLLLLNNPIQIRHIHDLKRLTPISLREKVLHGLSFLPSKKSKSGTNFAVFVKQDRDQSVYRKEISAAIEGYLISSFRKWTPREPADVEFWVLYTQGEANLGLRLTDLSLRQRTYKEIERPGSLRPTLAASMVLLSNPKPEDVIVDPMCGVGTLGIERALWGEYKAIYAGDLDRDAVEIAELNGKKAKVEITWEKWDATAKNLLAEHRGEVTTLLCNLPFGKKFTVSDIPGLYQRCLLSWIPLLHPQGKMILLTSQGSALERVAKKLRLKVKKLRGVTVQGIRAGIFELKTSEALAEEEDL